MISFKKIRQQYLRLLPSLNQVIRYVNSQLMDLPSPDFIWETNFKPYSSIKRKFAQDKLKHVGDMSDLVRGRVFFSDQYDFDETIDLIKRIFDKYIHKIEPKKASPNQNYGLEYYGVVHVDMDIDGVKFELQVMPIEFRPHKQFLHRIYEKLRCHGHRMSDKQLELLKEVHNKLYKTLDNQAKINRQQ